ncbi:hypothetical protein BTHE_1957 [Bifidobacterium thermophilum]|nr:hypothetical protein BTHE_1957 [Bifidobacterium thermophilum]
MQAPQYRAHRYDRYTVFCHGGDTCASPAQSTGFRYPADYHQRTLILRTAVSRTPEAPNALRFRRSVRTISTTTRQLHDFQLQHRRRTVTTPPLQASRFQHETR